MNDETTEKLRVAARNIQGNLGRCLYRRKDVDEMQEVCDLLFEAAGTIESMGNGTLTAEQVSLYLKALALDLQSQDPFKSLEEKQAIIEKYAHEIAELGSGNADTDDALALLDEIREAGRISYDDYSQLFDAIAELGSGMLTVEQVREAIEQHSMWVIGNNRCFRDGAYEEIADELNAELRKAGNR